MQRSAAFEPSQRGPYVRKALGVGGRSGGARALDESACDVGRDDREQRDTDEHHRRTHELPDSRHRNDAAAPHRGHCDHAPPDAIAHIQDRGAGRVPLNQHLDERTENDDFGRENSDDERDAVGQVLLTARPDEADDPSVNRIRNGGNKTPST